MRSQKGFTLIELMITIPIAAILLAVAVPNLRDFLVRAALSSQSIDFMSDLALARSEAAKRGSRVTVCISANGTTCSSPGTDWAGGRIVFVDAPVYGTVDGGDTILKVSNPNTTGNTVVSTFSTGFVQYLGSGVTNLAGAANTVTICKSGQTGSVITISATGRVHSDPTGSVCP